MLNDVSFEGIRRTDSRLCRSGRRRPYRDHARDLRRRPDRRRHHRDQGQAGTHQDPASGDPARHRVPDRGPQGSGSGSCAVHPHQPHPRQYEGLLDRHVPEREEDRGRRSRRTSRLCASRPRLSTRSSVSCPAATSRRLLSASGSTRTQTSLSSTSRPVVSTSAQRSRFTT